MTQRLMQLTKRLLAAVCAASALAGAALAQSAPPSPPACDRAAALHGWWSPSRGDNFATTQPEWRGGPGETRAPDYRWVRIEGYLSRDAGPGLVPVYSWWSPSREDNFLTTDPRWAGAPGATRGPDYSLFRVEGYIADPALPPPAGATALHSAWSPGRGDNFATTLAQWRTPVGAAHSPDYTTYRIEGYVFDYCR